MNNECRQQFRIEFAKLNQIIIPHIEKESQVKYNLGKKLIMSNNCYESQVMEYEEKKDRITE